MIYRFCTVLLLVLLVSHETRSEIAAPPAFEETWRLVQTEFCLLYTSDAADD